MFADKMSMNKLAHSLPLILEIPLGKQLEF